MNTRKKSGENYTLAFGVVVLELEKLNRNNENRSRRRERFSFLVILIILIVVFILVVFVLVLILILLVLVLDLPDRFCEGITLCSTAYGNVAAISIELIQTQAGLAQLQLDACALDLQRNGAQASS